jgi:hypothetical protein
MAGRVLMKNVEASSEIRATGEPEAATEQGNTTRGSASRGCRLSHGSSNSADPGSISDPLSIGVPKELWALMGISLTSLIGSLLILNAKKSQQPKDAEVESTLEILDRQGEDVEEIDNVGRLLIKEYPAKAKISDLFKGVEVSNAAQLDLVKVQMF